jgi:ATP-dependent RNA helicase DeaD
VGEEEREGAARSQHVVLQGPADARTMAAAMRPGVERSRISDNSVNATPGCVIITPTVEQALAAADQARVILADDTSRVVPVSQVARARRVLGAGPAAVVTGTAVDLLALRKDSALPLDGLRAVVLIGLDDLLAQGDTSALESFLADVPADAMRVATLDVESPAVEAFLEAQLRKARRIAPPPAGDTELAVTPSYVISSLAGRADALRHVLDAIDPPSLVVVAGHDQSAEEARRALVRVGLIVDGLLVQVVRQPTSQHVSLVVLWDAPASAEALTEALATKPVDAIALLSPEELPAFRRLTHGTTSAWVAPARKYAANARVTRLRAALRAALDDQTAASASELALLTPLLDEYDAVDIASATLRLYESALKDVAGARAAAQAIVRPTVNAGAPRSLSVVQGGGGKQRVFLAVGKRDNVRVGDIVGAVANEAGISGDLIGAVELFESHATVELSADDAARAVAALASATLRGRQLSARIDERGGREEREARPKRTFGPPRDGARPPMRGAPRGEGRPSDRGGPPSDRPPFKGKPRGEGRPGDRPDTRGPRSGPPRDGDARGPGSRPSGPRASFGGGADTEARRSFGDRSPSERTEGTAEWAQRGERMKNAKRTPRPRTETNDEG